MRVSLKELPLILAFELGYKACEKGLNLQRALSEFYDKITMMSYAHKSREAARDAQCTDENEAKE